jgi:DNA-binding transcriptional LysR family regulator
MDTKIGRRRSVICGAMVVMMELGQIRAFLAVAEELHFGRAAERLHMAQPPMSRMIKNLEIELGAPLFERTTRAVRLSPAGQAFLLPARAVLESISAAKRAVASAGRGETGLVRIGFAGPSSHRLIAALCQLVRKLHPGIQLDLKGGTFNHAALRGVIEGDLDLAVARWRTQPDGIACRPVAKEHFVLAVPTGHPFAARKQVSVVDCRTEAFIALPHDPGSRALDTLVELAGKAGYMPAIAQTAPDIWTSLALVAAGAGIAFTYDSAVANVAQAGVTAIPINECREPNFQYLAWRKMDRTPALLAVLAAADAVLPFPEVE